MPEQMYNFYTKNFVQPPGCTPKILLIMKLTTLILITAILQVSASSSDQKITLSEKNAPLSKIFEKISDQTGYDFLVSSDNLKQAKPVTINVQNEDLKIVLNKIFDNQPLNFVIQEKMVVVTRKEKPLMEKNRSSEKVPVTISGKVTDTTSKPLSNATIKIGQNIIDHTKSDGTFSINANSGDLISISFLGYETFSFRVNANMANQNIVLHAITNRLTEVVVSTGYQTVPKERLTGSFVQIDSKLLNRSISTNVLDRLDGITSGLIFNKNLNNNSNQSAISIRGRSTIYANPNPLIVVDNFPYDGDLSSINPNDVESITVLKDAAAASIWGAFSGNGVIVITTKKGRYNQGPKVELNSNVTFGGKPDLFYAPRLSSAHYIEVEQYLFKQGFYDYTLTDPTYPGVSPIVTLLDKRRSNLISAADSAKVINQYKGQDTRNDELKYLYRNSVNQQYNFNISGGGNDQVYYFSAGYDKNLNNINRNDFSRISINGANTYTFFNKRLELSNAIYYNKNITNSNGINDIGSPYPYLILKNANGNAAIPYRYRQEYIDTVGNGNLLDWNYRPLDELQLNNNRTTLNEYRINTSLRYTFLRGFNGSVQYQFYQGNSDQENLYDPQSFYVRDYINQFTQYDPTSNTYSRPVPLGGILDKAIQTSTSQNFRAQLNYTHHWNTTHSVSALLYQMSNKPSNLPNRIPCYFYSRNKARANLKQEPLPWEWRLVLLSLRAVQII
jgi:TonB-dependent SusC/RagA subfamily outer membrane receptor